MKRTYSWPEGHWGWPVPLSHKHGVRCGPMLWVGGQVDLTPAGDVRNAGDLGAQLQNVVVNITRVLEDLGAGIEDLVHLTCFYVDDGSGSDRRFRALLQRYLADGVTTCITVISLPHLAYEGLMVEIEAVAMRSADNQPMSREHYSRGIRSGQQRFCEGLRCGQMIFVSAQSAGDAVDQGIVAQTHTVMARIREVLEAFGAGTSDVVKINRWYAGGVGVDDFEPAALACASYFTEPGPAATGIPVPGHADPEELIQIAVIAMLGHDGRALPRTHSWPDSLWDWHTHLPYKHGVRCGNMIYLGGQVSLDKQGRTLEVDDLPAQTHQAMRHIGTLLRDLGADYDDVCKVLALYQGDCGAEALHANLPIRSSYFREPGPATTGVPLPALAYRGMVVEIDVYAMVDADTDPREE